MSKDKTGPTKDDAKNAKDIEQSTKKTAMSRKEIRMYAEEQARLERESNSSLNDAVSIQQKITDQLVAQNKHYQDKTRTAVEVVSLSKKIEGALKSSVYAGKNLNDIEKSLVKNKNLGLDITRSINNIAKDEGTTVAELLAKKEKIVELEKKAEISAIAASKAAQVHTDLADGLLVATQEKEQAQRNLFYLEGDISKLSGKERAKAEKDFKKLEEEIKLLEEKEQLQKDRVDKSKILLDNSEEASIAAEKNIALEEGSLSVGEERAIQMMKSQENLDKANKKLEDQKNLQLAINEAMGISGKGLEAINKALGGALGSVSEITKQTREQISDLIEQRSTYDDMGNIIEQGVVGKMEGFGMLTKNIGKSIFSNMIDPVTLLMAAFDFSNQTKALRDGLAISEKEASLLVQDLGIMSAEFGDIAITGKKMGEAMLALNKHIGVGGQGFKAMAAEAAVLMDRLGMSAEQTGNMMMSANVTGKSITHLKEEMVGAVVAVENANGVTLDLKSIIMEASSVTGEMRANFGGSVVEIAKGIAMAKSFGMELKDLASASASLLDFESSIGAELEAELLTGKQLNLERARAAALAGDQETLAKELNKNIGTYAEFMNMNVLQRQAQAKAMGMTVDQMEEILNKGKSIEQQIHEARAAGNKELVQTLEKKALQEQFLDIVENIKQKFVEIAGGPIGEIVKIVAEIAEGAFFILNPIFKVIGAIAKLFHVIKPLGPLIAGIWMFSKVDKYWQMAKAGAANFTQGIKDSWKTMKDLGKSIMSLGKKASNIKFDPRMAGGGRFKDVGTGKMVSNKAAEAAGAKKTDLFKGVKPKDISKDATAATKGGAATGKSSKGMAGGLKELAKGLKAMGAGKVMKGILNMALAGPAFIVALPAIPFLLFMGLTPLKQLFKNFNNLAKGLGTMGGSKSFKGIAALAALGIAGALAVLSIPFLLFVGIAGPIIKSGLKFLGQGLKALGQAAANPYLWLGIAAIAALGVALIPFGIALAFAGAAMWMFGLGIQAALEPIPPIIEAVAAAIVSIIGALGEFFTVLGEVDWKNMLMAAPALMGLGLGLLTLGWAALAATPGLLMMHLFGLPVIKGIAEAAPQLDAATQSIEKLAGQVSTMSAIGEGFGEIAKGINKMTFSLALLTPFLPVLASLAAVGLIGSTLEKVMGGGEDGEDGADGEGKKTTVVSLDEPTMKQLASMVADAVSNVSVNTEVTSDIWGGNNKNAKGNYQGKVKGGTALV